MSTELHADGAEIPAIRTHESADDVDFSPEHGFALVKVAYERPPAEAQTLVARFDRVDDVVIPAGTPKVGFLLYDAAGHSYTRDEFERATAAGSLGPTAAIDKTGTIDPNGTIDPTGATNRQRFS